jgi:predicted HTH domain antitoxin
MNKILVKIEVPEDILISLKYSSEEFQNEMKLITAIELYKKGKLSLGKAAQFSGFTKYGFIDILNFRGEPVFNYTNEDIEKEIENIRNLSLIMEKKDEDCK